MNRTKVADGERPQTKSASSSRRMVVDAEAGSFLSLDACEMDEVAPPTISKPPPTPTPSLTDKLERFPSQILLLSNCKNTTEGDDDDDDICRASDLTFSEDGRDRSSLLTRDESFRQLLSSALGGVGEKSDEEEEESDEFNRMKLSDHIRKPIKWRESGGRGGGGDDDDEDEDDDDDESIEENARFRLQRWRSQSNLVVEGTLGRPRYLKRWNSQRKMEGGADSAKPSFRQRWTRQQSNTDGARRPAARPGILKRWRSRSNIEDDTDRPK